jgi:hypothetical protein
MYYPGKRDWWIAGLLGVVTALELVCGGTLLGIAVVGGVWPLLIPAASLLGVGGLLLWILYGTSCDIGENDLVIRCGPFRRTVPLDAIEDVVPAGFWYAGPEWSLGLSVRALRLRYRKHSGRLSWPIRFSPVDRAAFLLELAERLPELEVKDDGSLHRPAPA